MPRAVPGRQLRRATAGWNGTAGSATTSARFLKGDAGLGRAPWPTGCPAARTSSAQRSARPEQSINFVDLPRRLHAQRPRLLRPQAQRGQRRREPRRSRREPQLELRRAKGRPTIPAVEALAQPPGQEPPRRDLLVRRHADAADGRRSAPDPARQQQRLLPRRRDRPGSTGRQLATHADVHRFVSRLCGLRLGRDLPRRAARHEPDRAASPPARRVARRRAGRPGLGRRFAQPGRSASDWREACGCT